MSSSNQLSIPFRRSTHLALSAAIRRYVADKYGQHPDTFADDFVTIDNMRRDAVNMHEPHPSGIKKLQAYAAQLAWISGKFPAEIGAEFTWYPALGYNTERPVVQDSLQYERLNILYNLAALYCQLAVGTSHGHGNADGLKTAASYFMQAAGVLQYMRTVLLADNALELAAHVPEDMDAATLSSLEQLMLAQAQECFWMRAVSEGYKDATIAKLAARLSDLYNDAGEAAVQSDAISRAWMHHITAKHHHFSAAAQYRASLDCLEKRRYGEEVARLQDALKCAAEGLKQGRGGQLSKTVQEDLQGLKRRVEEDLKRAEKDNDLIYLNIVPPKSELRILDRANMAVARVPEPVEKPFEYLGEQAEFGPALFAKLVPFAVHLAVSVYEERRDRLVNQNIIHDLEVLTEQLHATLLELKLPGALQAAERPLGLPGSLVQHAEELRQADALSRLRSSFADIDKLRTADQATFDEGRAQLAAEADEDEQLRRRHGTERWPRPPGQRDTEGQGAKLWATAEEIAGYFASSASSDGVVRDMLAGVQDLLALLAGPERALLDFVPQSRAREGPAGIPEALRPALGRLRSAYNDVLRLESRRRNRVEALRDKARGDDVKPDIMKETGRLERARPNTPIVAAHFDTFFAARLRDRYDADQAVVERETTEQARLLEDVGRAHREVEAQKRRLANAGGVAGNGSKEREAALQQLDNAYYKYKEIVRNVEVGRKFYNDLAKIVSSFRDQCRAWAQRRRTEAQSLEDELSMPVLSSLSLGQSPAPSWAPSGFTQSQQEQQDPQYRQQTQEQQYIQQQQQQQQQERQFQQQQYQQQQQQFQQPQPAQQQQQLQLQQPQPQHQPQSPQKQVWSPDMAIRFGPSSGAAPQLPGTGNKPSGTWNPAAGIRFG